jgi:hypothetical protein
MWNTHIVSILNWLQSTTTNDADIHFIFYHSVSLHFDKKREYNKKCIHVFLSLDLSLLKSVWWWLTSRDCRLTIYTHSGGGGGGGFTCLFLMKRACHRQPFLFFLFLFCFSFFFAFTLSTVIYFNLIFVPGLLAMVRWLPLPIYLFPTCVLVYQW